MITWLVGPFETYLSDTAKCTCDFHIPEPSDTRFCTKIHHKTDPRQWRHHTTRHASFWFRKNRFECEWRHSRHRVLRDKHSCRCVQRSSIFCRKFLCNLLLLRTWCSSLCVHKGISWKKNQSGLKRMWHGLVDSTIGCHFRRQVQMVLGHWFPGLWIPGQKKKLVSS